MEKLIVELFGRIKELEERVANLEAKNVLQKTIVTVDDELNKEEKITRKVTRKYVIEKLQEKNQGLYAQKGSKSLQTDIVIDMDKKNLKVKYFHSKSYNKVFTAGWNTVNINDIENIKYDLYIFCIDFNGKFKTFLFTNEDMINLILKKQIDVSGNYHFYIHIKEDGRIVECRDEEIDISKNYENWNLATKLIKNKK